MRRGLTFFWIAAAVLGSVAWINHVPYRADSLWRVVPADALWVSRHRNVAERWPELTGSWLAPLVAHTLGVPLHRAQSWLESRPTTTWARQFGGREVWLFGLPDAPHRMTIGACAWIGGQSWRWRWALSKGQIEGIRWKGVHGGRTIWVWTPPDPELRGWLALTVEEGLLLACWSEDPSAIVRLLDAYDGTAPRHAQAQWLIRSAAADAAVGRFAREDWPWDFRAEWVGACGQFRGRIEFPSARLAAATFAAMPSELPHAVRWVQARAVAYAWVVPDVVVSQIPLAWRQRLGELVDRFRMASDPPWLVAIHDAPLEGRFRGLRVPGVTLSMRLRDGVSWSEEASFLVDWINARERWGCVGAPLPGVPGVMALEFTGQGPWRGAPLAECIGWTEDGRWVTIANSASILQMLKFAGMPPPIAEAPAKQEGAQVRFVVRVPRAVESARLALAVAGLLRLVSDPASASAARLDYERWSDALAWLGFLARVEGELVGTQENIVLYFHAFTNSAETFRGEPSEVNGQGL